jgi:putative membrane protein
MRFLTTVVNYISSREPGIKGFIITLYVVGIIGTAIPFTRGLFIFLTPFILLLSLLILIVFHTGYDTKTLLFFLIIFLLSFFIEVVGVNTGVVFGNYSYGRGLGIKLLNTPLLIGLNWVLLVYCTSAVFEKIHLSFPLKIAGASLLMVIYDIVMEQVAPFMDMWSFGLGRIPLQNYLVWFTLALIFHTALRIAGIRISNKFAPLLFYCQFIFFLILALYFKFSE